MKGKNARKKAVLRMALSKEGNPAVQYKGIYYELPIKPQGGIYEGFTPIKQKYPLTIHRNEKGEPYMTSMVCPPPTRRDIMRRIVSLELSMKDAQYLSLMLTNPRTRNLLFSIEYYTPSRKRILSKLKREGVKL